MWRKWVQCLIFLAAISKVILCGMPIAQIAIGELHTYLLDWVFTVVKVSRQLRLFFFESSSLCPPGTIYLHECPRERFIPIYLIVVGVFGLILSLLSCLPCARESEEGTSNPLSTICTTWNSLTSIFLFCWFIAGELKSKGRDLFLVSCLLKLCK